MRDIYIPDPTPACDHVTQIDQLAEIDQLAGIGQLAEIGQLVGQCGGLGASGAPRGTQGRCRGEAWGPSCRGLGARPGVPGDGWATHVTFRKKFDQVRLSPNYTF